MQELINKILVMDGEDLHRFLTSHVGPCQTAINNLIEKEVVKFEKGTYVWAKPKEEIKEITWD
jgi:hypothetical protein